jgi:sugar/nucleoside kinase (ribokinase family)
MKVKDTLMQQRAILCLGIMVADVVARPVDDVPAPGRLSLVEEMSLHTGGCAVNAATVLARLGMSVELAGKVGDDPFGDFMVAALDRRKIGRSGVRRDPAMGTSATMVLVDSAGERRFIHYIGANAGYTLEDVDMAMVERAAVLHVAGSMVMPGLDGPPTAELLRRARAAGVTTFLDTVWNANGRWRDMMLPCLPHIDYFVPSLPEAQAITGREAAEDVARTLLDHGVGTVALKMGARGSLVMAGDRVARWLPAFDVTAVDATGAGDSFAAGFIAGTWLGWDLARTQRLANATGALAVMGVGAAGATRDLAGTVAFMESTSLTP